MNNIYLFSAKENLKSLRTKAKNIAKDYQDKGAIIATMTTNGQMRIGTEGLTPEELRELLCAAIHYSFIFEENS